MPSPPPTVLVGHSAGGFAITAAALQAPEKVAGLIYLLRLHPPARPIHRPVAPHLPRRGLTGSYAIAPDRRSFTFRPDFAPESIFFHDCADASARMRRTPSPRKKPPCPRSPTCPRAAIFCAADHAIPLSCQQHMAQGIAPTATLPCGHAPFLALPTCLAATIRELSDNFRR